MKKIGYFILVSALSVSLIGCSNTQAGEEDVSNLVVEKNEEQHSAEKNVSNDIEDYMDGEFVDEKYYTTSEELVKTRESFYDSIQSINETLYNEFIQFTEYVENTDTEDLVEFNEKKQILEKAIKESKSELSDKYQLKREGFIMSQEMDIVYSSIQDTISRCNDFLTFGGGRFETAKSIIKEAKENPNDFPKDNEQGVYAFNGYLELYKNVGKYINLYRYRAL